MLPDAVAPDVFAGRFVEGLERGGMGQKDVVDRLFHLFHRAVQHVIYLLVGQLERCAERGRVGPANTNDGHLAKVDLGTVHAHGIRVFKCLEDLTRDRSFRALQNTAHRCVKARHRPRQLDPYW